MNKDKNILIGLTGAAGSGKDTFASFLAKQDSFRSVAFADPLKEMMCTMLGITRAQLEDREYKEKIIPAFGKSPRQMMQTLGTEWGRELVHPDIWLILAEFKIKAFLEYRNVVVTDVRFENEATMIRNMGGTIVHIKRPNMTKVNAHASEKELGFHEEDLMVVNDSSLKELEYTASKVYSMCRLAREEYEQDNPNPSST